MNGRQNETPEERAARREGTRNVQHIDLRHEAIVALTKRVAELEKERDELAIDLQRTEAELESATTRARELVQEAETFAQIAETRVGSQALRIAELETAASEADSRALGNLEYLKQAQSRIRQLEAAEAERGALKQDLVIARGERDAARTALSTALQQCAKVEALADELDGKVEEAKELFDWGARESIYREVVGKLRAALATPSAQEQRPSWDACRKVGGWSGTCDRGTRSCNIDHAALAQESSAPNPSKNSNSSPASPERGTGGEHVPCWAVACPCGNYFQPCDGIGGNKCQVCERTFDLSAAPSVEQGSGEKP